MMSLHDQAGGRKYLTREEHIRFLLAADQAPRDVRAFCHTLGWSGCRISEALALTAERVDVAAGTITFETLKKRRTGVFRAVPVPPELATMLDLVFGLRGLRGPAAKLPLWSWSRATAWRRIKEVLPRPASRARRPAPRGCATPWASPRSDRASRSTWCSAGWATPSSPPRRSTPRRSARRNAASPHACGDDVQTLGTAPVNRKSQDDSEQGSGSQAE